MFLQPNRRSKDDKEHTYWSLVETVRTRDGPRQMTLCYLGELNSSAQARWLKTAASSNVHVSPAARRSSPAVCCKLVSDQLSICLGSTNRTDANRNFVFCPVPAGSYEVVAAAVNGAGMGYGATVITGVQPTSSGNTFENRRPSGMIP